MEAMWTLSKAPRYTGTEQAILGANLEPKSVSQGEATLSSL